MKDNIDVYHDVTLVRYYYIVKYIIEEKFINTVVLIMGYISHPHVYSNFYKKIINENFIPLINTINKTIARNN